MIDFKKRLIADDDVFNSVATDTFQNIFVSPFLPIPAGITPEVELLDNDGTFLLDNDGTQLIDNT